MAMTMTGEVQLAAPRQTVWEALNNPDVLKATIPGCESLEKTSDTSFAAVAVVSWLHVFAVPVVFSSVIALCLLAAALAPARRTGCGGAGGRASPGTSGPRRPCGTGCGGAAPG